MEQLHQFPAACAAPAAVTAAGRCELADATAADATAAAVGAAAQAPICSRTLYYWYFNRQIGACCLRGSCCLAQCKLGAIGRGTRPERLLQTEGGRDGGACASTTSLPRPAPRSCARRWASGPPAATVR